jgi:hypothetical protein
MVVVLVVFVEPIVTVWAAPVLLAMFTVVVLAVAPVAPRLIVLFTALLPMFKVELLLIVTAELLLPMPMVVVLAVPTFTVPAPVVFRVKVPVPLACRLNPVLTVLAPITGLAPENVKAVLLKVLVLIVPPTVMLLVTLKPVPEPVALKPPLKVEAVAVDAPLPVTVARVSASVKDVRQVAVVHTVPVVGKVRLVAPLVVKNSVLPAVPSGTIPELSCRVMVLAAVGLVILRVRSLASADVPSKTNGLAPLMVPVIVTVSAAALPKVTLPLKVAAPVRFKVPPAVMLPARLDVPSTSSVPSM